MKNRKRSPAPAAKIDIEPLLRRLKDRGVNQSQFARDHGYTAADITNWKARGVPRGELPKIAGWCGITPEQYLAEAAGESAAPRQHTLESSALVDDYNALPEGLKEIVARQAAELRVYFESLPTIYRDALKSAPKDPAKYVTWEKDVFADIEKRRGVETGEWPTTARIELEDRPRESARRKA